MMSEIIQTLIISIIISVILNFSQLLSDWFANLFTVVVRGRMLSAFGNDGAEYYEGYLLSRWEICRSRYSSRAYALVKFLYANCGLLFPSKFRGLSDVYTDKIEKAEIQSAKLQIAGSRKPPISKHSSSREGRVTMAKIYIDKNGYKRYANSGKLVHKHVAERMVGGEIYEGRVIHHRDGNKLNNKRSNLQIMPRSKHSKLHAKQRAKNRKKGD